MATEQTLTTLIINKVDSKETFNKMKAQGLVNENELYLTPEGAATEQQIKVQNNEPANAVANDLWLDLDEDAPASLPISGGTLTGPLAMSNNKITGVSDPTQAQDVATKNYVDKSNLTFSGTYDGSKAISITIPAPGISETQADSKYLQLSGGTVAGELTVHTGLTIINGDALSETTIRAGADGLPTLDLAITPVSEYALVQKHYVDTCVESKTNVVLKTWTSADVS